MPVIQAIETHYAGCHFRSRLEARWAVFFDALGITWEYEPQGFVLRGQIGYLPDFHLPMSSTWVEVKGSSDAMNWDMAMAMVRDRTLPNVENSWGSCRGLLVLGPIPEPGGRWAHPIIQAVHYGAECPESAIMWLEFVHWGAPYMRVLPAYSWDVYHDDDERCEIDAISVESLAPDGPHEEFDLRFNGRVTMKIAAAYRSARSARFEHGESG